MKKVTLAFFLLLGCGIGLAQQTAVFQIDSLPPQGILLDKGWKWHAGDNPDFAKADFDDSKWESIDPTKDIFDLPQISKDGKIGWFRLKLSMNEILLQKQISLVIQQTGASEIYLNGLNIVTNGIIDKAKIVAKDPLWKPFPINLHDGKQQVIAVKFALQPNILYTTLFENYNPAFWIKVMDSAEAVGFHYSVTSRNLIFIFLIIGISLMIFIIHYSFYLLYPDQKANLYFSLFSLFFLLGSLSQYFYWLQPFQVAYKFYLGNLAFLLFIIGYYFLLTSAYLFLEKKKDFFYYFLSVFSIIAVFLNAYPYNIGWKFGGPMQELFIQINIARIAVLAVRKKQKGTWIIAVGAFSTLVVFIIFLSQGTFTNASFLLSLPVKRMVFYLLFCLSLPVSTSLFLAFQFADISKGLTKKILENETLSTEKQQILSTQNETLEKQVHERTAELEHKNRDLEIEAALERVRSASLAIHQSHELEKVVVVLFDKLNELGVPFDSAFIYLFEKSTRNIEAWVATNMLPAPVKVNMPYDESVANNPIILDLWYAIENGEHGLNKSYKEKDKDDYYRYEAKHNPSLIPASVTDLQLEAESWTTTFASEKNSIVGFDSWDGHLTTIEDFQLLKRFAKVFEQAYIRFLDLQKAEAQTREAQIEVALEKIRSRTLAMQQSSELKEIVALVHEKLKELNVVLGTIAFWFFDKEKMSSTFWVANDLQHEDLVSLPYDEKTFNQDTNYRDGWQARFTGKDLINRHYNKTQIHNYFEYVFANNSLTTIPANVREFIMQAESHIVNLFVENNSILCVDSWTGQVYSDEMISVLKRAAKVFEQAYVRFLDLQKAEAQTREAQIETSFERIRASALAMQSSDEFLGVVKTLYEQINTLGQKELEATIIQFYDVEAGVINSWAAQNIDGVTAGNMTLGKTHIPFDACELTSEWLKAYQSTQEDYTIVAKDEILKEWLLLLLKLSPEIKDRLGDTLPETSNFHFSKFSKGALSMVSQKPFTEESKYLLKRAASTFDLAYKRYLDLQLKEEQALKLAQEKQRLEVALTTLKATQAQLIQSEKLASLGELTAGIAHEIQNPLNFVNNFSELSVELAEELQEALRHKGIEASSEEGELLSDLIQNQEKINLHGKRASSIVKGMLEHSRASTGVKELTDINKLADEYLRLSYHGIRAKDNTFNCDYKTDFDENLPRIEVIPQDIGRVLLNLINNAFYAVSQRQNLQGLGVPVKNLTGLKSDYTPSVIISTQQVENRIIVKVSDNGIGMSEATKAKVFQPFFTTKPTGQGTGLGLSLAYDIVTKGHGGTLEVESNEGVGSIFILKLKV